MSRRPVLLVLILGIIQGQLARADEPEAAKITHGPGDWPWWRGPLRNGVADPKQKTPLSWSDKDNVLWRSPVPGRGHGSPTVVGDQVFLATAEMDQGTQSVLCFDRLSGELKWQTEIHKGGLEKKGNAKSSLASATVACDGERLFINFFNGGAIHLTSLTRAGKIIWQKKITDYSVHQGFGSSPALYESLVFVSADSIGNGAVAAFHRISGKEVWRKERPKTPNYASPIILHVAGRDQLLFTGCDLVTSFEPLTGKKYWEIKGSTTECVTSTVTDGERIFTSGGYPKNHLAAVRADGSGKVDWQLGTRVYVPSLLIRDGYLFGVLDAGVAMCWKSDTGKEIWKGRLGGDFSASPVLVGDHIFATNEAGRTYIFKASTKELDLVGENQLGEEALATPTFCGDRIYFRVASMVNGQRRETLYCIGKRE